MTKQIKNLRQREHQANERTFLAWLRTSISLIGFGLAIARFGLFLRQSQTTTDNLTSHQINSEILGMSLIIAGLIIVGLAALRYNRVYRQIEQRNYRPSRYTIWIVTGVIALLGVLSLPLVWGGRITQPKAKPTKVSDYLPQETRNSAAVTTGDLAQNPIHR
ncbi:putative membrane protein [Xenococcus sp. PCC 7305]|uniref:YidH family protein n=1 Tax=Xenococcus sp. PCC 7305 TaxID=102125 RepID=UPI0002AC2891|nr:DUF202 domain-containing protein [Xenococcus sp. PCC 7305]ELS00433.1 putative membrane protein [Xenococcus sp. PCC 7305]